MTEPKKIVWLKWIDPFAHLIEKQEPLEEDADDLRWQEAQDSFVSPESNVFHKDGDTKGNAGPAIVGPMGMIPIHEHNLPGRIFNFWVGHTNFDITTNIAKQIAGVRGVEALDVFSRYRFRIAIGKVFDQTQVKQNIDAEVCPPVLTIPAPRPPATDSAPLERMSRFLKNKFKFWAIGVMPLGAYEVVGGNTIEEVQTKMKKFAEQAIRVVVSWEEVDVQGGIARPSSSVE